MKKTTLVLLLSALTVLLMGTACKTGGFKTTKSGLMYKIISTDNGPVVKRGDVIKFHVIQKLRDSTLGNSYERMPFYAKIDSIGPLYDPQEIFPLLRKGDSAIVILMADSLAKRQGGQLPDFIKPKDQLVLSFHVIEVFHVDSLAQKDQMAEMQKAQQRQQQKFESMKEVKTKEIEEYLAKNKIPFQKTPEGTYIQIKDPGNGKQIDTGKQVTVLYSGKSFPSMKVFDQNMDGSKPPLVLVIGEHKVIPGWEEGLKYFKKGGKGTLYIPFFQGYGPQSPTGAQYETMIFDVVVTDVSDSVKKESPMPGMPQQMPQGR